MAIKVKLFNKTIKKESADNFLILEAGTNHYELGDCFGISHMEAGREMISAAASTGADAIKFQIYKADTLIHKKANDYKYDNCNNWNIYVCFCQYNIFSSSC